MNFSHAGPLLTGDWDGRKPAEGTAHKLVTCKCGRTMPSSEDRGDSSERRRIQYGGNS